MVAIVEREVDSRNYVSSIPGTGQLNCIVINCIPRLSRVDKTMNYPNGSL